MKEGLKEGLKEGEERGREEGRKKEKLAIAKNLLESGMSPMRVAEITKLDIKEVQSLEQAKTSKH